MPGSTCIDAAEAFLAAVGGDDLHAWATIEPDRLLADASRLDALPLQDRGPLFGELIGVKDNYDTADLPTEYGSPIYAGHRPGQDAEAVARLRRAGALIAGKTKLTEFAWMHPADTVNPLDGRRTPGGSSSGSAAAVGAGQIALATGTQTAGSLNRPASYCGVVGYKATFGLIPTTGIKALAPSLDTVGIIGRSVADIQRLAGPLAGQLPGSTEDPPAHPNLAFARTPWWDRVEPMAQAALERALATIPEITELYLPDDFMELTEAQTTIQNFEAAIALGPELEDHPELISDWLRGELRAGASIPRHDYDRAVEARERLAPALVATLSAHDAVLTPSTTGVPPLGLESTGDAIFCRAWNLVGAPCVSLPLAWTDDRLPAGLQLVGAPRSDARLLSVAAGIMAR